jgi:hypothetical protein
LKCSCMSFGIWMRFILRSGAMKVKFWSKDIFGSPLVTFLSV